MNVYLSLTTHDIKNKTKQNREGPPDGLWGHQPFFIFKNNVILETWIYQFDIHVKY